MWVKICGTTNLDDARLAIDAGADAVGFVFTRSPRQIETAAARDIIRRLPDGIEKVGVFHECAAKRIWQVAEQAGLTAVQIYGLGEAREFSTFLNAEGVANSRPKIIVALGADKLIESGFVVKHEDKLRLHSCLVDSGNVTQPGGTGKTFDWEAARSVVDMISLELPVVVAGGLNPENVSDAICTLEPNGVDVCSGVEREPGLKDPGKVKAFVAAARAAAAKAQL